jgi:hypothetical protein
MITVIRKERGLAGDSSLDDTNPVDNDLELARLRQENEQLRQGAAKKPSFWLAFFSTVFILFACVAMVGAVSASWLHNTALDTRQFVNTVAPLIKDARVSRAISQETVSRLFDRFGLTRRIEQGIKTLPEPLKSQAKAGAAGAKNLSGTLTADILKSNAFQTVWRGILTTAHQEALKGLKASGAVTLTESGEVIMDVSELLTDVKDRLASLGLGFLKNQTIPKGLGQVVLYQNSQLGNAKKAVNTLNDLFMVLPIGAVALMILGAAVANDSRRAMIGASAGFIVVLTGLVIALKVVQYHYINPVRSAANRSAAMVVASHVQGGLNRIVLGIIILAVLTIIAAMFAGPYRWASDVHGFASLRGIKARRNPEVSQSAGFFTRYAWPLRIVGLGAAILLLLYLPWASVALVVLVCVAYFLYLLAIEFLR